MGSTPEALVVVDVIAGGINDVIVAKNYVHDRVRFLVDIRRVAPKHVGHGPTCLVAGATPAIAVVARLAARPGKLLDLVSLRIVDECEVRMAGAATLVMLEPTIMEAAADPVLEVELLVVWAHPLGEHAGGNGCVARYKGINTAPQLALLSHGRHGVVSAGASPDGAVSASTEPIRSRDAYVNTY